MTFPNGYETQTTFYQDFLIAEKFGINAVKDTFNRAFKEWKTNVIYCTELALITNLLCWIHYDNDEKELSALYGNYYDKVRDYALGHFKGEDFSYYYHITD